jgi:methylated-DNA-[protein]-cysteine S-methyltransferase
MNQGIRQRTDTPLGPVTLWVTPAGLAGLWFDSQAHLPDLESLGPWGAHPWLSQAAAQLEAYFAGESVVWGMPLDLSSGTPFQQAVWRQLLCIERGATTHYGQIAQALGKPKASRAVGAAVGRNPLSIIVPCHRVVGAQGALTGYAGGLWRKIALLQREGVLM